MKNKVIGLILILISTSAFGQKPEKNTRYFDNPIIVDSSSSLIIPVRYNVDLFTSNKVALWNDYYANIIFYDIKTDSSKRLFKDDTFIKGFSSNYNFNHHYESPKKQKNISQHWVFYFVTEVDYNKNGKIDGDDPSILYVTDKNGNGLQALTQPNENAVSIDLFDQQGFALVKIQRDMNKDKNFDSKDKDYYYIRLDLKTLRFGNKIETSEKNQL